MKSHFEKIEQVSRNLVHPIMDVLGSKPPRNQSIIATFASPTYHPINRSPLVSTIYWL